VRSQTWVLECRIYKSLPVKGETLGHGDKETRGQGECRMGILVLKFEAWNLGLGIWVLGLGSWDLC